MNRYLTAAFINAARNGTRKSRMTLNKCSHPGSPRATKRLGTQSFCNASNAWAPFPTKLNDLMELIRRRVSALGQKQTLRPRIVMSALPPIAEIGFVGTARRTSGLRRPFMQHHADRARNFARSARSGSYPKLSDSRAPVFVLRPRTTLFYDIAHIVEYKDREGRHALPLLGTKSFVEWLPRLGEFIQIG
jgi:hypothetical protein